MQSITTKQHLVKLIERLCGKPEINLKNLRVVEKRLFLAFEEEYDTLSDTQGQNFLLLLIEINTEIAKALKLSYPSDEFHDYFNLDTRYASYLQNLCLEGASKMSRIVYSRLKPSREPIWQKLSETKLKT